ncbi:MAG: DUF3048 domain-containing protein [Clostridium sp.]|nr:DUF3048 domain-containing protein [Clostridium sp.]
MSNFDEIDDILEEIKNKTKSDNHIEPDTNDELQQTSLPETAAEPEPEQINLNQETEDTAEVQEDAEFTFSEDAEVPAEEIKEEPTDFIEVIDTSEAVDDDLQQDYTLISDEDKKPNKKKTAIIIAIAAILIAVAVAVTIIVVKGNTKEPETTTAAPSTTASTTAAPVIITNPLTNEADYNTKAVDKRPVAIVVENASQARPQWSIDDKEKSPDIIVEGEVEGGETRMLWLYADYTNLPKQIGPIRSARPPFIKFSELFDSIFIHWGQSSSKGNYVGANTVFSQDKVDHINQMAFSDTVGLYARDHSRNVATEHTGILYGDKVPAAIEKEGFRTDANEKNYTKFSFNSKDTAVGKTECNTLVLTFSSRTKTRDWTYNSEDKTYHTSDFSSSNGSSDVSRKNLLILFDNTEYVVKENYKNSGRGETYCDYKLSGGTGKLASLGTVTDINWSVKDGVLVITDNEGKTISLNSGKTWIGYASANHEGTAVIG